MNKRITAKDIDNLINDDVLSALPENRNIKRGVASWKNAQNPKWKEALKKATSTDEYKENLKKGKEEFWQNAPESHRKHIAKKAADGSLSFESKEQAEEIFWKCWEEDRGEKLYKKLAKEYDVSFHGIISLVRGNFDQKVHLYCPVSYEKLEKMKEEWEQKFKAYTVVVQSPGSDLLEEYDSLYKESEQYRKVVEAWKLTTPSVVFHCRFKLKNPTPQSVRDYCDSIGIPRIKNDLGQYKQILNDKWKWLTTKKSKKKVFNSYEEVSDFLSNHPENTTGKKIKSLHDKMPITWRDGYSFAGWMIRKE